MTTKQTYITEVVSVVEKWSANNIGTSPTNVDIIDAIQEGIKDAEKYGLIKKSKNGVGYEVADYFVK